MKYKCLISLALICINVYGADAQISGSLDSSFGINGIQILSVKSSGEKISEQNDGKFVVTGSVNGNFAIVRLTPDGFIDSSWGMYGASTFFAGEANSVTLQVNGKMLIGGRQLQNYLKGVTIRLQQDGNIDNTFAAAGILTTNISNYISCNSIVVQQDSKVVLCGYGNSPFNGALMRFDSSGLPDSTFGINGVVTIGGIVLGIGYEDNKILLQADGRIIVVSPYLVSNDMRFGLIRYNQNGQPDSSFGTNGIVSTHFTGFDQDITAQILANGNILVAGYGTAMMPNAYNFTMSEYDMTGNLITSFGNQGKVITNFAGQYGNDQVAEVAVQNDGKIILGGYVKYGATGNIAMVRYMPDGSPDSSFGEAGEVITSPPDNMSYEINDLQLLTDGSIIVSGTETDSISSHMIVAKYKNGNYSGIKEIKNGYNTKIYPNPSEGDFSIDISQLRSKVELNIVNSLGQIVYTQLLNNSTTMVHTGLPNGLYYLEITDDKVCQFAGKLIIGK